MHVHLTKWLREIIKKERVVPHMLALRRRCLDFSKFIVITQNTERWLLASSQNKDITCYIFHKLIPKSVLVFFTFGPTLFHNDTDFMIAKF